MKYKHIIWDWNGTLIDDRRCCIDIMNEVLKKPYNIQPEISAYQNLPEPSGQVYKTFCGT